MASGLGFQVVRVYIPLNHTLRLRGYAIAEIFWDYIAGECIEALRAKPYIEAVSPTP